METSTNNRHWIMMKYIDDWRGKEANDVKRECSWPLTTAFTLIIIAIGMMVSSTTLACVLWKKRKKDKKLLKHYTIKFVRLKAEEANENDSEVTLFEDYYLSDNLPKYTSALQDSTQERLPSLRHSNQVSNPMSSQHSSQMNTVRDPRRRRKPSRSPYKPRSPSLVNPNRNTFMGSAQRCVAGSYQPHERCRNGNASGIPQAGSQESEPISTSSSVSSIPTAAHTPTKKESRVRFNLEDTVIFIEGRQAHGQASAKFTPRKSIARWKNNVRASEEDDDGRII